MSVVVLIFSLFGVSNPAVAVPDSTSAQPEPMRWYGVEAMLAQFEAQAEAEAAAAAGVPG